MNSDITIELCIKVEIYFQEKYVFLTYFYYRQKCDKTLATTISDNNKGHFTQK